MKDFLSKNRLLAITFIAYLATLMVNSVIFVEAVGNTWIYVREMLEILPAVFIISALVTVWVPPQVIIDNFGVSSGLRGKLISVLIGSVSAGPIYAAFPVTKSLLQKGASLANIVIIISAWAVVKIPMLIVEVRFLGLEFAGARYLLTVPAIMIIGSMVASRTTREGVMAAADDQLGAGASDAEIVEALPGLNCGSCGYDSCGEFAQALKSGKASTEDCSVADTVVKEEIRDLLHANTPD